MSLERPNKEFIEAISKSTPLFICLLLVKIYITKYEYSLNKNNDSNALRRPHRPSGVFSETPGVVEPYWEITAAESYQFSFQKESVRGEKKSAW